MTVFSAMYHTLFLFYLQDIRATTCLRATWGKVSVEVFAVNGKLRGMKRKRVRNTFDVHFGSQEEKAAFVC